MANRPLVSVVIPAYNAADFIGAAIDSVLAQTHESFELLVVDDGSTDDTSALVQSYATRDARIRLLRRPNGGVARARNLGIRESRGELIATLDADDIWFEDKLTRQIDIMQSSPEEVGLVYCWSAHIDVEGRWTSHWCSYELEGDVLIPLIVRNLVGNASTPLIRRSHLERAGGYDTSHRDKHAGGAEDWDLYLRLAEICDFRVVPEFLVSYRQRYGNMSSNLEVMNRAHRLVMESVRRRHPELSGRLFRWSAAELAFYLSFLGVTYHGDWKASAHWLRRALLRDPSCGLQPRFHRLVFKTLKLCGATLLTGGPVRPSNYRKSWTLAKAHRVIARKRAITLDPFHRRIARYSRQ